MVFEDIDLTVNGILRELHRSMFNMYMPYFGYTFFRISLTGIIDRRPVYRL